MTALCTMSYTMRFAVEKRDDGGLRIYLVSPVGVYVSSRNAAAAKAGFLVSVVGFATRYWLSDSDGVEFQDISVENIDWVKVAAQKIGEITVRARSAAPITEQNGIPDIAHLEELRISWREDRCFCAVEDRERPDTDWLNYIVEKTLREKATLH